MIAVRLRHTSRTTFSGLTACKLPVTPHGLSIDSRALLHKEGVLLQHTSDTTLSGLETFEGVLHSVMVKENVHPSQWADVGRKVM